MADHNYFQKKPALSAGRQCFALNCFNYDNIASRRLKQVSFHRFPNKEKEAKRWKTWWKVSKRKKQPSKHAVLCSAHFDISHIDATGQTRRLREGAVPSPELVVIPGQLKKRVAPPRTSRTSQRAMVVIADQSSSPATASNSTVSLSQKSQNHNTTSLKIATVSPKITTVSPKILLQEHSYGTSNKQLKDRIMVLEKRVEKFQKEARNSAVRERRVRAKLKEYMTLLKENNLLHE